MPLPAQLLLLLPGLVLGQGADLDYTALSSRKDGRHFLVTTLLEKIYEPLSSPRYRGKVVFQLPPSLGGPDSADPPPAPCCRLKDVPGRTEANLYYLLEKKGLLKYPKAAPIFDFDAQTKKDIITLADIINGDQQPFDHMFSIAATVKDMVNDNIFAKAIVTITVRRTDVGFAVPNLAEVMTKEFMPNMNQLQRQVRQLDEDGRMDADQEILVDWEKPEFRTYPADEVENKLWYLREDPEVNSHHWYWHILFGDNPSVNTEELQHRRGELFYYLHNQVTNRYNFERISNGMELAEGFGPQHWDKPIPLGYDAKLGDLSAVYYPARENNVTWYGHPESTVKHKQLVSNLQDSIRKGYLTAADGSRVPLGQKDGKDFGIMPLGAVVEQDPKRTVNKELYGDIHNGGHKLMSRAGLHPQLVKAGIYNAVGNTATECRDPLLFRWHGYIDSIFEDYKKTLPDYTNEELNFPGLEVEDVSVFSFAEDENDVSGRTYVKNKMFTHMDKGDVGFYGIDINNTFSDRIRIKYKRLNHSPFIYRFKVRNDGGTKRALVRIFLADERATPTTVEMDKFIWNFHNGVTEFDRSYDSSSVVPRKALGLYEIQEGSYEGVVSEVDDEMINEYTGCGWAKHLLVPRGNPEGLATNLLVVISQLMPEDDAADTNWETVSTLTHSLCGAPGAKFPDSRPMGFPFDRYRQPSHWRGIMAGRTNMKRVDLTIVHQEECSRDRDCASGVACDREAGRCSAEGMQRRRRPRLEPLVVESCPAEPGTKPGIQVERVGVVSSAGKCETKCRQAVDCTNYEWQKVSGGRGRCLLYHRVALESGHPTSTSGRKRCSDVGPGPGRCTLRDQQPVLKYVETWYREAGAEACRARCEATNACQIWEFRVVRLGDTEGTCHAYAMSFRTRANSVSGPVQCSI